MCLNILYNLERFLSQYRHFDILHSLFCYFVFVSFVRRAKSMKTTLKPVQWDSLPLVNLILLWGHIQQNYCCSVFCFQKDTLWNSRDHIEPKWATCKKKKWYYGTMTPTPTFKVFIKIKFFVFCHVSL